MKKLIAAFLFVCIWAARGSGPVLAHMAGQPPFFKINGVYADLYPVPGTSLPNFSLPQDMAPQAYVVGQQLDFEIDFAALGVPEEIFRKTEFQWDFGDHKTTKGTAARHSYNSPGSYLLSIKALSPDLPEPQLFQTVLIQIVAQKSYVLPQAQIKVNGQIVKSMVDVVYADLSKPVAFESVGDAQSYFWDFGDGNSSSADRAVKHLYPVDKFPGGLTVVSAVLRVKNTDGFLADTYTMIYDDSLKPSVTPGGPTAVPAVTAPSSSGRGRGIVGVVVGCIVVGGLGILVFRKK